MPIFDDKNRLSSQAIIELKQHVDMLDCECPTYLIALLEKVREFTAYSGTCIQKYPADAGTHRWLESASNNIDSLLSATIAQLARIEGFIDVDNEFVARQASER